MGASESSTGSSVNPEVAVRRSVQPPEPPPEGPDMDPEADDGGLVLSAKDLPDSDSSSEEEKKKKKEKNKDKEKKKKKEKKEKVVTEDRYVDSESDDGVSVQAADYLLSTKSFMRPRRKSISLPLDFKEGSSLMKSDEVIQEFGG